ncbi:peptidylprolyl isomerase [candidate division WOR-3 bacterium]|nr:peptidylprolyl isomerase [candidate division WOR-3 bacterium]
MILAAAAAAGPADSIVAVVGDQLILASELNQAVTFMRLSEPDSTLTDYALQETALGRLIDDLVLEEQARRESVEVQASDIAAEVNVSIAAVKERFGDEEQFQAALAAEGYTERALRQRYEEDARRKLLARRLMDKEGLTQIYISPGEAERFYNENRDSIARMPGRVTLAHILIGFTPGPAADSIGQRRMTEVMDVLARGGDFATVASSFSDDKKTAARGGDRGWVQMADLPPELMIVLPQLEIGQTSPPFPTREGYMTVKLEEEAPNRVRFRQILIRVPVTRADTTRTRNLAAAVRRKALDGVPFDSLAREYSQDPATADSGGWLGEFLIPGLAPPFNTVVAGLDSGDLSEPVFTEHGYHVIKVLSKQPERVLTYLELQDNIRNYLYQQKLGERLEAYLDRVRGKVYVKRFRPNAAAGT